MTRQQPVYVCTYRDGTRKTGTYAETLLWFNQARQTDNPCTVTAVHTGYKAP